MRLSEWLKDEMSQRGMTQAMLARKLEVDASLVSRWLKPDGSTVPESKYCEKIAQALGVDSGIVFHLAGRYTPGYSGAKTALEVEVQRQTLERDMDAAITYIEDFLARLRSQRSLLDEAQESLKSSSPVHDEGDSGSTVLPPLRTGCDVPQGHLLRARRAPRQPVCA